jgi:hypothetical protein
MFERILGWLGVGGNAAKERAVEELHMSPSERRFAEESIEGHQADEFVEGHLGGGHPERLAED